MTFKIDHALGKRLLDRLLFFSDAVFAIVLTLLVLELRPPASEDLGEPELLQGIADMSRHFASFAISFALGGAFWLAHMRTTRALQVFDWPVAAANLIHLLTVALLPFAAAMLGEHISSTVAFASYSVVMVLVSFTGAILWLVANRDGGRLVGGVTFRQSMAGALRTSAIGWCFVGGFALAINGQIELARFCWAGIFPLLLIARLVGGPAQPAPQATAA